MSDPPSPAREPANDELVDGYNDVPYTSFPNPAHHPDRLATIGTLLGLDVAPVATCRVLEFACGNGSNLVPIASTLPNANFVGFDFAAQPIARAQRMARELELTNIRLLELDLRDLPADLGEFDYIIAHGLYSWVPPQVRAHVLPMVARHLAANGVAFVSYNTLPGCHMRRVVWDMLKYHTRDVRGKAATVAAARKFLDIVATPVNDDNSNQQAMRAQVRDAAGSSDAALAHDDLSESNDPVYFHEFMGDAARAGLTFLAEANMSTMLGHGLAPQVRQTLGRLDRLEREQYLDFIHFRAFRESLLCHVTALSQFVVQPARAAELHLLPSLEVRQAAASSPPGIEPDAHLAAIKRFLLAQWPRSVTVAQLGRWRAQNASAMSDGSSQRPTEQLAVELHVSSVVDLRTAPVAVAAVPGERPEAFAAARWINREHEIIPSLYHEALRYQDPLARKLLALLDGTRSRDELMAALGAPFAGPAGRVHLDNALKTIASKALLLG